MGISGIETVISWLVVRYADHSANEAIFNRVTVKNKLIISLNFTCLQYESQSSFGSIYKTRIEGNNMFCDYYNPSSRTYCKRLRVLCPEHSKDPKASDTEVSLYIFYES